VRTFRVDPHVHTEGSWDSREAVEDVLFAAADSSLDGLAVTDHDVIEHSLYAVERAPDFGLFAIPGVEVSTVDGHLLALGVEETPPEGRSFGWTVDWVHERDGVAVVPHPFRLSSHGVGRDTLRAHPEVDAIETFNACTVFGYRNRQARAFASRHDCPRVGSSDAHRADRVGDGFTRVHVEPGTDPVSDYAPVLAAIRDGRTSAHGRRSSVRSYVAKYAVNASARTTR
jgi:predicted metal-dependent phosphoesterase TrpH